MAEALEDAMEGVVRRANPSDVWRFASYKQYMRKYNDLAIMANSLERVEAPIDFYDLDKVQGSTNTIAMVQQELFESVRANLSILRAYLQNRVEPKADRIAGVADFLAANLRRAMLQRPEREKEVQDVIEQLLIGRGMEKGLNYDRESGRVKVSAKEVIPDFNLPDLRTAIEVKLVKESTTVGNTIDELNADIQAYKTAYSDVVFVIYDVAGKIRDDSEFRRDLEAVEGVRVLVVKH